MYRSLILTLEVWKSICAHRPLRTMAAATCTIFLHHHHLLYSDQSVSLQIVTYTQNTGEARLQSVLWLSYSPQPSTVPVPIRISAQSAPTSLCITCRGTTWLSAVSLLIWNSQDSQAQWSYLSPQHSGACSYVFEASLGHKEMKGSYKHKNTTENWLWTMQGKTSAWHPNLKICHYVYVTTKRKINSNITSKCFGERLASHSVFTLDYLHDRNTILEVAFNFSKHCPLPALRFLPCFLPQMTHCWGDAVTG